MIHKKKITALLMILTILICIKAIICLTNKAGMSSDEKILTANKIIAMGQPSLANFKSINLHGDDYYRAKRLWAKKQYDVESLTQIF